MGMIFEQPLNEHMRTCLRLEYLFATLDAHLADKSSWGCIASIQTLNNITELLDRNDLRKNLSREINRLIGHLSRLKTTPGIDEQLLDNTIAELHDAFQTLQLGNNKFASLLRNNDFLASIRQYQLIPGGISTYNTPALQLWLEQNESVREQDLQTWLNDLHEVRHIASLVLNLLRQCGAPRQQCAERGFYQQSLDSQVPCQLIRVEVPKAQAPIFPVISASRHAISIRFNELDSEGQEEQCEYPIEFTLTCCVL